MNTQQELLRETEARELLDRFRQKSLEAGKGAAYEWWRETLSRVAKIRGQSAADDLRARMNRIVHEIRSQN